MTRRLLAAVLVAVVCVRAHANLADFNALTAGSSYAAPAIFSNGGLDFDVLFSFGSLNVASASGLVNPSFTGNYLNLTLNIDMNVNLPAGADERFPSLADSFPGCISIQRGRSPNVKTEDAGQTRRQIERIFG